MGLKMIDREIKLHKLIDKLEAQLKLADELAAAVSKARCDSVSGVNCDDDSCADKILPPALEKYIAARKGE